MKYFILVPFLFFLGDCSRNQGGGVLGSCIITEVLIQDISLVLLCVVICIHFVSHSSRFLNNLNIIYFVLFSFWNLVFKYNVA